MVTGTTEGDEQKIVIDQRKIATVEGIERGREKEIKIGVVIGKEMFSSDLRFLCELCWYCK